MVEDSTEPFAPGGPASRRPRQNRIPYAYRLVRLASGLDRVVITGGLKRIGWHPRHFEGSDRHGLRRTAYGEETSRE